MLALSQEVVARFVVTALFMVRAVITILSQPNEVVKLSVTVCVVKYHLPLMLALSQLTAVKFVVTALFMVSAVITILSQPKDVVKLSVSSTPD